jgi:MoxR-like ATPase
MTKLTAPHGNPFTHYEEAYETALPACDRFDASFHRWSQPELDALALAWAARRPLLVRGEPGSGKSQLARAAAELLQCGPPLVQVIHPRFEPRDLLYRYDTLRRLSDANAPGGIKPDGDYVKEGVLWRAFEMTKDADSRVTLLIDEIDKADADVPNSLLDVLGHRSFSVDEAPDKATPKPVANAMPLIIITTNEERELPAAFVRRCVVLNLTPPLDETELLQWLKTRVEVHRSVTASLSPKVVERALKQVLADRADARRAGFPPVGLAEALDLLTALAEITGQVDPGQQEAEQNRWLDRLSAYALVKNATNDAGQRRKPVAALDAEGD